MRCWKISWLMLRPNGRCLKQNLPMGVRSVVSSWEFLAIGTLQYPALASNLLKIVALANFRLISSSVDILCGHLLIALFRCLRSRHTRMLLSFFVLSTRLEHQSVCSCTLRIMSNFSILCSSSVIFGKRLTLCFLGLSILGSASLRTCILAGSLSCPILIVYFNFLWGFASF